MPTPTTDLASASLAAALPCAQRFVGADRPWRGKRRGRVLAVASAALHLPLEPRAVTRPFTRTGPTPFAVDQATGVLPGRDRAGRSVVA